MKRNSLLLIAGAIGVVLVAAVVYSQIVKPQLDNRTVEVVVQERVTSLEIPMAFSFPSGAQALTLIQPPVSTSSENGLKKVYLLLDSQAYLEFSQTENVSDVPPPTISIFAFANNIPDTEENLSRVEKLTAWVQKNPQYSSWSLLSSESERTEVDGATALRYQTKSTYSQDVYVVSYKKDIYVFTGQFEEQGDKIQSIFADIMSSVSLD